MNAKRLPLSACLFLAAQLLAGCSSTSNEKVDAGQRKYCDAYCWDGASDLRGIDSRVDLGGTDASSPGLDSGLDGASVDTRVPPADSSIPDAPSGLPDATNDSGPSVRDSSGTGGTGGTSGTGGAGGTGGIIGAGGSNADARPDSQPDTSDAQPDGHGDAVDALADTADVPADTADVPPDIADGPPDIADVPPSLDLPIGQDSVSQPDSAALSCLGASATFPAQQWIPTFGGIANGADGTLWATGNVYCPTDSLGSLDCSIAVAFPNPNPGTGPSITSTGGADVFLVKLDPATGLATFAESFGQILTPNTTDQNAFGVAVAKSGGVGLIGSFVSEIDFDSHDSGGNGPDGTIGTPGVDFLTTQVASAGFVATFDQNGNPVHSLATNVGSGTLLAIASNPAQDAFAVCGVTTVKATGGILTGTNSAGGGADILVAKIDATTGAVIWGAQFGGAGDQLCQSVAMDSAGNVIIAGGYNGTLQFGALAAFPTVSGSTSSLLYVATLDGVTGTPTAASTWGTAGKVSPFGITVDASNNIIVAGSLGANVSFGATAGTITDLGLTDAFVVKMSVSAPTLSPIWAKSFGDATFDQQAKSVATSSNGDVYLAGLFVGTMGAMNLSSFGNTTTDGFVAHLSGQDGSVLCAQRYGDTSGIQEVDAITVARAASGALLDNVAVGGAFTSTITFGATTLSTGPTQSATFVSGLSP